MGCQPYQIQSYRQTDAGKDHAVGYEESPWRTVPLKARTVFKVLEEK